MKTLIVSLSLCLFPWTAFAQCTTAHTWLNLNQPVQTTTTNQQFFAVPTANAAGITVSFVQPVQQYNPVLFGQQAAGYYGQQYNGGVCNMGGYDPNQQPQAKAEPDACTARIERLTAVVEKLAAVQAAQQQPTMVVPIAPPPFDPPRAIAPPPDPPQPAPVSVKADDGPLYVQVGPLAKQNCASCHSGEKARKGLYLDGTRLLSAKKAAYCAQRVGDGSMPDKKPLDPAVLVNLQDEFLAGIQGKTLSPR